jgi:hypothetical protein
VDAVDFVKGFYHFKKTNMCIDGVEYKQEKSFPFAGSSEIVEKLVSDLNEKLRTGFDEIFIDALRIKGYSFEDIFSTHNFIRDFVSCEINQMKQTKTFKVKGVPFLFIDFSIELNLSDLEPTKISSEIKYKLL